MVLFVLEHGTPCISAQDSSSNPQVNVTTAPQDVWVLQDSGTSASLRGLCAISKSCCWASGASGTVIRTTDGGESWQSVGPANAEIADFRDIQAWDESTAVIMSAGEVDRLYYTSTGGTSWTVAYEHPDPIAFFDGMSFDETGNHGWLMGDPINGKVFLLTTDDGGRSWDRVPNSNLPTVADGIAAFAASGTHLLCPNRNTVLIGLGGADATSPAQPHASVLMTTDAALNWQNVLVPISAGQSAGVFSMTTVDRTAQRLVVVGGDYLKPEQATDNVAISDDGGRSWRLPKQSRPHGFRSVVVSVLQDDGNTSLFAAGPSGTDQSHDGGESWSSISNTGFHTISFLSPSVGWAAGADGRIARWQLAN